MNSGNYGGVGDECGGFGGLLRRLELVRAEEVVVRGWLGWWSGRRNSVTVRGLVRKERESC
jgi:hypothetical protein